MKIAITSTGNSPEATLDSRFGRCSYFVIYDTKTGSMEFIPNPNRSAMEGAGPASVQLVASRGVEKVISGEFGAKVKAIFDSLKIQLIIINDTEMKISRIIEMVSPKKINRYEKNCHPIGKRSFVCPFWSLPTICHT